MNTVDALRLSVIESTLMRIRRDAGEIESVLDLCATLRTLNPACTPVADLRIAARNLRTAANHLDTMASLVAST